MSDIFVPFAEYPDLQSVNEKLDTIFAQTTLPVAVLKSDEISPFHEEGIITRRTCFITQYIAFSLKHSGAAAGGHDIEAEDNDWIYWRERIRLPFLSVTGIPFDKIWLQRYLNREEQSLPDHSVCLEAESEVRIDLDHLCWAKYYGTNASEQRRMFLAANLCMPGSHVVTAHRFHIETSNEKTIPTVFEFTVIYRNSRRLRDHLARRNKEYVQAAR